MTVQSYDTLIVGGGIIGLFTAWELAQAGHKVAVLERGELGREASWAGGGILCPLYPWRTPPRVQAMALDGHRRYAAICAELRELSGVDPEYTPSGLLMPRCPESRLARQWAQANGIASETLDKTQVLALAPALNPALLQDGEHLWWPEIAQLRNPRLLRALAITLQKCGVALHQHTEVAELSVRAEKVQGLRDRQGRRWVAERVVLAAGAWTSTLLAGHAAKVRFYPVKGEILLYSASGGLLKPMVLCEEHYLIPRRDGRVLVGSTVEEAGFDKTPSDAARQELNDFATRSLPALQRAEIEAHWAGLRPGCSQAEPCIAVHDRYSNLYINAGHYRNGIVCAPAAALRLAGQIDESRADRPRSLRGD